MPSEHPTLDPHQDPRVLRFHPEAERALNQRAKALLLLLSRDCPSEAPRPPDPPWVQHGLQSKPAVPIGPVLVERRDPSGEQGEIFWAFDNGTCLGLYRAHYVRFLETVEALHRNSNVRWVLSEKFVAKQLITWLRESSNGVDVPFCRYLEREAAASVKTISACVPVHGLIIECPFKLGRVVLRPVPNEMFDRWEATAALVDDEQRAGLRETIGTLRQEHQGKAAVILTATAEPDRVSEMATEEAERVLSVLRLFDPGMVRPGTIATSVPFGLHHQPASRVLILGEDGVPNRVRDGFVPPIAEPWLLSRGDLQRFFGVALTPYSALLAKEDPTPFESDVLRSISLYTEGGTRPGTSDRLMYTFTALETIMLRDAREPLAQSVGDRLAFSAQKDPAKRKRLVELVKNSYDARSRFVHHGEDVHTEALVTEFLHEVWKFYVVVLPRSLHHRTKAEFIDATDEIKYS